MRTLTIREKSDGSWTIDEKSGDSVWPQTTKKDALLLIARLMQLVGVKGPVWPQTEPERIELSSETPKGTNLRVVESN